MKSLVYSVAEYQSFGLKEILESLKKDKTDLDEKHAETKAERFFTSLEKFAQNEKNQIFLKYSQHNQLKTQNYVGIIQTPYGTLEIFPKCFSADKLKENPTNDLKNSKERKFEFSQALKEAYCFNTEKGIFNFDSFVQEKELIDPKNLLLNFLKTLKNSPLKDLKIASLQTLDLPLLDIFIQMFIKELHSLIQRGIRNDYIAKEDHRFYLKGKLLFKEQIRHNAIHKERFFTSSDEFIVDIAENRLIKSTLIFLKNQTTQPLLLTSLNTLLCSFSDIPPSNDPFKEFSLLKPSRHFDYYQNTLRWCELFLQKKHFSPYGGEDKAYALLFPTEKLFESYVASMLKKHNRDLDIKEQCRGKYFLEENGSDKYALKPDLWIDKKNIIIDTKWKIINDRIAESDLYQMWAYVCKYRAKEVWLIYPFCEKTEALQKKSREKKWIFKAGRYLNFCDENQEENQRNNNEIRLKILFAPLPFL